MDILGSIQLLKAERNLIYAGIEKLTQEQLLKIPDGYKNNILWNLGHIVVTQQVLHYTLSRLDLHIPKEIVYIFRTGTSPVLWTEPPDAENIKSLLLELPVKFLEDYKNRIFKEFRPYKTSTGIELKSFEDSVTFNHFHEGTHTGIILSLIKRI